MSIKGQKFEYLIKAIRTAEVMHDTLFCAFEGTNPKTAADTD